MPMARANTFVDPPGSGASAVSVPDEPVGGLVERAVAGEHGDDLDARRAAPRASRAAWPRRESPTTSRSWSAPSAFWITTRRRSVTDDAVAFDDQQDDARRGRQGIGPRRATVDRSSGTRRPSTPRSRAAARARGSSRGARRWRGEKRAAFRDEEYWGRPVPGFGDPRRAAARRRARAGRARRQPHRPGVHRRPLRRLALRGAAPRRVREPADVGHARRRARAHGAYVAAAVRCAPPENKPTPEERDRCLPFLVRELALLDRVRVDRRARRVRAATRLARRSRARGVRAAAAAAAVRARRGGADGGRVRRPRLVPPEPAEHVHRQAHRADARRGVRRGPASSRQRARARPTRVDDRDRRRARCATASRSVRSDARIARCAPTVRPGSRAIAERERERPVDVAEERVGDRARDREDADARQRGRHRLLDREPTQPTNAGTMRIPPPTPSRPLSPPATTPMQPSRHRSVRAGADRVVLRRSRVLARRSPRRRPGRRASATPVRYAVKPSSSARSGS